MLIQKMVFQMSNSVSMVNISFGLKTVGAFQNTNRHVSMETFQISKNVITLIATNQKNIELILEHFHRSNCSIFVRPRFLQFILSDSA